MLSKKEQIIYLSLGLILGLFFISSYFSSFNYSTLTILMALRGEYLDKVVLFISDYSIFLIPSLLGFFILKKQKLNLFLIFLLSFSISLILGHTLKQIFHLPRPDILLGVSVVKKYAGFSFPSMHTAFAFSFLPLILTRKVCSNLFKIVFVFFAISIGISRIYLGAHLFTDVTGGALLGYITGFGILYIEYKTKLIDKFLKKAKDHLELRRQIAHVFFGIGLVVLISKNWLNIWGLGVIIIIGGILILSIRWKIGQKRLSFFYKPVLKVLKYFERPLHLEYFPGKGPFFMCLGAFLTMMIFEKQIVLPALTIMAVGDSITHIFGKYIGKIPNPWNKKKHFEGYVIGVLAATFSSFYFIPLWLAFLTSLISMFIESIEPKIGKYKLDDNIFVPLIAGGLIWLLG